MTCINPSCPCLFSVKLHRNTYVVYRKDVLYSIKLCFRVIAKKEMEASNLDSKLSEILKLPELFHFGWQTLPQHNSLNLFIMHSFIGYITERNTISIWTHHILLLFSSTINFGNLVLSHLSQLPFYLNKARKSEMNFCCLPSISWFCHSSCFDKFQSLLS